MSRLTFGRNNRRTMFLGLEFDENMYEWKNSVTPVHKRIWIMGFIEC